ncbi:MAG: TolC family protein [Candidatus Riflebacteria bacterium]|nr:TolC family protein [Candidatus Riflebacteria bacterium]
MKSNTTSETAGRFLLLLLSGFMMLCPAFLAAEELSATATASATIKMSLAECVALAVRRNTSISLAYMDRVITRYNFVTGHDYAFRPNVSWSSSAKRSGGRTETVTNSTRGNDQLSSGVSLSQPLKTGGSVSVAGTPWARSRQRSQTDLFDPVDGKSIDRSWNISISQPLLKNSGTRVGTADVRLLRLSEDANILSLKDTVMAQVSDVIKAYRSLLQAKWMLEINKASLDRANKQMEMNKLLIDMGRMAQMELIQSESDVANRELSLDAAINSFDQARIALLKALNLDIETLIDPEEELASPTFDLSEEEIIDYVSANQPGYLGALINLESLRINLIKARSSQQLDLNLTGSWGKSRNDVLPGDTTRSDDWAIGLELQVPVYGSQKRSLKSSLLSAENELKKAEILQKKRDEDLRREARDKIRQIKTYVRQIGLAARARELAQKKLELELDKLKAGKTTNFQLVTYQDELRNLQIAELGAQITYLNAITDLDQFMGLTTSSWGIELNANRPDQGPLISNISTASASNQIQQVNDND